MFTKLAVIAALFAGNAMILAQDPESPEKGPDKEVADRIKVLNDAAGDRKMERDPEAIETIDFLLRKLREGLIDKDQKAVTKALDAALMKSKKRPADSIGLYTAAVAALGYCGADGAKSLEKAYDSKRFPDKKPWVPLREQILRSVGKTKDAGSVKFLIDEARRSPEDALMAAAGEALGNFEDAKQSVRKEITSEMIKKWGALAEKAGQLGSGNTEAQTARNTLAAITGKWNDTLARLTRQNHTKFIDWQSWHNKNKSKDWK